MKMTSVQLPCHTLCFLSSACYSVRTLAANNNNNMFLVFEQMRFVYYKYLRHWDAFL